MSLAFIKFVTKVVTEIANNLGEQIVNWTVFYEQIQE